MANALRNSKPFQMSRYPAISIGIAALDARLKDRAENDLTIGKDRPVAGGKLLLTRYHNHGAALNLGQHTPKIMQGISVVFTILIAVVFVLTLGKKGNHLLKLGLSLLLGGAFSNTYDRLSKGYVVDYFRIGARNPKIRRVIFNISDFAIMIGALLTVISQNA
ncbi:MAG: signal peptidase II [Lachnospiraceae bacterium]|nr:signal peptidase II [Lachnospiraceae bacterium]